MSFLAILAFACICIPSTCVLAADEREIIPGTNNLGLVKLGSGKTRAGITYYVSDFKASYTQAFTYCALTPGRKLAIIKDDLQQAFITSALIDKAHIASDNLWFNSYCYGSRWFWGDTSPITNFTFHKFFGGVTSCRDAADNIMMFGTKTAQPLTFTWKGEHTEEENFFVCQSP